jgi:uncharacterized protein (TIGR02058 family)
MAKKRFIVELGTGADLHGENVTKAACRAVRDAISRSCLCGIVEILGRNRFEGVHVLVQVACPHPEKVDTEAVAAELPVGTRTVEVTPGGMQVQGICVEAFGPGCSAIVVANAAVTVFVDDDSPRPEGGFPNL